MTIGAETMCNNNDHTLHRQVYDVLGVFLPAGMFSKKKKKKKRQKIHWIRNCHSSNPELR
jgi:hypothetical protein